MSSCSFRHLLVGICQTKTLHPYGALQTRHSPVYKHQLTFLPIFFVCLIANSRKSPNLCWGLLVLATGKEEGNKKVLQGLREVEVAND